MFRHLSEARAYPLATKKPPLRTALRGGGVQWYLGRMSRARWILFFVILTGMVGMYVAFMAGFAWWTHKLVYEDDNLLAIVFMVLFVLACGYGYEVWTTGEIRYSKTGAWRPKWNRTPPIVSVAPTILELRPDEYRQEHPKQVESSGPRVSP